MKRKLKKIGNYLYLETDDIEYNKKQLDKIDGYFKSQLKIMVFGALLVAIAPFIAWIFFIT